MEQMKKPIQLISIDQNKKLQMNPQAIQWLSKSCDQAKHVGVVTVVGKYRTDRKSYILNRVLLNQNHGFEVGPSINACTKGLWVWPELIQCPNDPTLQYMVMDTEGLNSLQEGEQNDTKVFLMALLLSSYFIYNSMGSIDEKSIQSLSLIINLSKLLQKGSSQEMNDIINCFPSFLWLVRDFALRLEDEKGVTISAKEYLQNALRQQKSSSQAAIKKNSIRKQLSNFFKQRDCFILIRPVDDEKQLQNMSKVKQVDMRPKFIQLVKQFQTKVLGNVGKKMFKGKPCSPTMLIQMCQYFCSSINKGGLPEIGANWDLVCRAESSRLKIRCLDQFNQILHKYETTNSSINICEFEINVKNQMEQLLKYFNKNTLEYKPESKIELKQKMQQYYQKVLNMISKSKNRQLQEQILELNQQIERKISYNTIENIFQITQSYDVLLDKQLNTATLQCKMFLYKKCYEGFKLSTYAYFGNNLQTHQSEHTLLSQKLGFYRNTLNRIQGQQRKKFEQADQKQRQLKQNIYQLEIKVRQATSQLQKAKKQLIILHHEQNGKQNQLVI